MRRFRIDVDIAADGRRVWDVMSDVTRWHEWTPSVTSITLLEPGELRVGTRAVIRQPRFPPALWHVTALEPTRSFTWLSTVPGVEVVAHHDIEPTVAGCRATLSLNYRGLFGGLIGRLTKNITERYLAFEAEGLKRRSEDPSYTCIMQR